MKLKAIAACQVIALIVFSTRTIDSATPVHQPNRSMAVAPGIAGPAVVRLSSASTNRPHLTGIQFNPRTTVLLDAQGLRIAKRISTLRGIEPTRVRVPKRVAEANRELIQIHSLARGVSQGDRASIERFLARINSFVGSLGQRREHPGLTAGAATLLAMAQNGPLEGGLCPGGPRGDLEILNAAFKLDAAQNQRDGRYTMQAAAFVREHRKTLTDFENSLPIGHRSGRSAVPEERPRGSPDSGVGGHIGRRAGELPPPPDRGGFPGDESPLIPPDTEFPEPPLPDVPGSDLCEALEELCIQLFNDFALASLADSDAQLIDSVEPSPFCAGAFDQNTEFTARPDAVSTFPADRGEYRLIFGGTDISNRIRSWATNEIRFTIPTDSKTGYVCLRRFLNTPAAGLGRTLGNLCGLPSAGELGIGLSPSPRALLAIVRAPVIESLEVNGLSAGPVGTEACRAVRLSWNVRFEYQPLGLLAPPGTSIVIEIRDSNGTVLHTATEQTGGWYHNPVGMITYRLMARSYAGQTQCGQAETTAIEVQREKRLYLAADEPSTPTIVAGHRGSLIVEASCPAPAEGLQVRLTSSDRSVVRLPPSVEILPGETTARVEFGTQRDRFGQVTLRAECNGHTHATITYQVQENLTAIVLSGGGAKGSFEVGAMLYLREIWNEIDPSIICGTSVGAINSLAIAESRNGSGINKLEQIWLSLEFNSDMFRPSPEMQEASDILGVPLADELLKGKDPGSIGSVYLNLVEVTPEAAAWGAVGLVAGGPLGALAGGLIQVFGDEPVDNIGDAMEAVNRASYVLDLKPTQDKITNAVDVNAIANSGMKLRLAAVALEDGGLYYITESSMLVRDDPTGQSFSEAISVPAGGTHPLVLGAMASSAIPGVFQARRIDTATTSMHYVDGGVKEVLPSFAAVRLGAQLLFTISASPSAPNVPDLSSSNGAPGTYGDSGRLLDIVKRGVDLAVNEVSSEEKHPRAGFCDDRERILIDPTFEVHDTTEIDPGLIRINMAYGYFRAYDADQLRRGNINALQYVVWRLWADDLTNERKLCHQVETGVEMRRGILTGFYTPAVLDRIRQHKNRIAQLIEERFDTFGADGFPRILRSTALGDQNVLAWCDTWEVHQNTIRPTLNGVDLWAAQIIGPGVAGEDGPSAPPLRESAPLAKYVLPSSVRSGLQAR